MKKEYVKPRIYFENFELSQSIAAGCSLISEGVGEPIFDPEIDLQVYARGTCESTPPNANDEICYDVPVAGLNVFTS